MPDSLFHRKPDAKATAVLTPHQMIEKETAHLKNRTTARYGDRPKRRLSVWMTVLVLGGLLGLYLLDPILHAWYRYDAIHAYTYLHNFGSGNEATELATCGMFRPDEIVQINRGTLTDKDDYATPQDAAKTARAVLNYVASVKALHNGNYEQLNWLGRLRYDIFVRSGLNPPIAWDVLDPGVPSDDTPAPAPQQQQP
jgi:hypothetical protein